MTSTTYSMKDPMKAKKTRNHACIQINLVLLEPLYSHPQVDEWVGPSVTSQPMQVAECSAWGIIFHTTLGLPTF